MSQKKIVSPNETGAKGIPPGVGSSNGPKKSGVVSPNEYGKRGKPGKAGFPGYKAARD